MKHMAFCKKLLFGAELCLSILLSSSMLLAEVKEYDDYGLSLADLLNLKVESVSKKTENIMDVASSIYVITQEDIRRSGAIRMQELLNIVPGLWHSDASYLLPKYGGRTEAATYQETMLFVMDGVPINSVRFGGLAYHTFDMPLKEIDRIEVIKGPGGTIYGANAVTAVVSIFTKNAKDGEGGEIALEGGTQDYVSPYARYSKKISDRTYLSGFAHYRTHSGYDKTDKFDGDTVEYQGSSVANPYTSDDVYGPDSYALGFNVQTDINDKLSNSLKFFYDYLEYKAYTFTLNEPDPWVAKSDNHNLIVKERIDFRINEDHALFFNIKYFNSSSLELHSKGNRIDTYTLDFEIQDNLKIGRNDISLGANYRTVDLDSRVKLDQDIFLWPEDFDEILYAAFIQDKINVWEDMIYLTIGAKLETWELISDDPEISPSIRLTVTPNNDIMFWGSASRNITMPGYDHLALEYHLMRMPMPSLYLPGTNQGFVSVVGGGDDLDPTEYYTYEFGMRTSLIPKIFFDISMFYSEFDEEIGLAMDTMNPIMSRVSNEVTLFPIYYRNVSKGESIGGELVIKYLLTDNISMEFSYAYFRVNDREGLRIPGRGGERYTRDDVFDPPLSPENVFRFRPYIDLPDYEVYITFDMTWRSKVSVGERYDYATLTPAFQNSDPGINEDPPEEKFYLNLNIEKRFLNNQLAFNIWGRNVLNDDYVEYYDAYQPLGHPHTVNRTFGCGASYKF